MFFFLLYDVYILKKTTHASCMVLLYLFLYLFFILNEKKNKNVLKQKFKPELISVINLSGRNSGPSRKSGMSDNEVERQESLTQLKIQSQIIPHWIKQIIYVYNLCKMADFKRYLRYHTCSRTFYTMNMAAGNK